jgi:hypothetical protein
MYVYECICEGKDEAMASRGAIFHSVAGWKPIQIPMKLCPLPNRTQRNHPQQIDNDTTSYIHSTSLENDTNDTTS